MPITTKEAEYVRWVLRDLGATHSPFIFLCCCLNGIEFYYTNPDDKNRVGDARTLRNEYIDECGDDILEVLPAASTVFEVLATMAKKADWTIKSTPYEWLRIFLENLGLDFLNDSEWDENGELFAISTIHKWLDRRFLPNGSGSPFRSTEHDLTQVSMWDSLQWYLADEFGEGRL